MPASQLVSAQHGIIAWPKNADSDTARLVVQAAILVRRCMEPTGHGVASNIGPPIPTVGCPATTTLSEGYWAFAGRTAPRIQFQASLIKRDRPQAARRVEIGEHAFDDQFEIPVRINGTQWMVLGNRDRFRRPYVAHVDEKTTGMV
jgi:hypothetical protein